MIPDWVGLPALPAFVMPTWQSEWGVRQRHRAFGPGSDEKLVEDMTCLIEHEKESHNRVGTLCQCRILSTYSNWFPEKVLEKIDHGGNRSEIILRVEDTGPVRISRFSRNLRNP